MKWGKLQDKLLEALPESGNNKDMSEELVLVMKNDSRLYDKWHRHFCRLRDGEGTSYNSNSFTHKLVCKWNANSFNYEQQRGGSDKHVCEYTYYRMMEELYESVWGLKDMKVYTNPCDEIYLEQANVNNEETIMVTIENKTLVNGKDVEDMSFDQLVNLIVNLEQDVAKLEAISVGSKAIAKKKLDLENNIKAIAKLLDGKDK